MIGNQWAEVGQALSQFDWGYFLFALAVISIVMVLQLRRIRDDDDH